MRAALERPDVRWPAVAALAVLVAVLAGLSGPAGAGVGVATAAIWYVLGTPYALAGGHIALPALFPAGLEPAALLAVFLAFLGLLVADAVGSARALEHAAIALACALVLGGSTWLALAEGSVTVAAATVLSAVAAGAYAIDRYARVRLGLASTSSPGTGSIEP